MSQLYIVSIRESVFELLIVSVYHVRYMALGHLYLIPYLSQISSDALLAGHAEIITSIRFVISNFGCGHYSQLIFHLVANPLIGTLTTALHGGSEISFRSKLSLHTEGHHWN